MNPHKRIRPSNTRATYPEQKLDNDVRKSVVASGNIVFLRGQVLQDLDSSENLRIGDALLQTRRVMENVRQQLAKTGTTLDNEPQMLDYLNRAIHTSATTSYGFVGKP